MDRDDLHPLQAEAVPRTAILVDARSRTTRENAVETQFQAAVWERGGLVYYRLRGWAQ